MQLKILLVEDNPGYARLIKEMLEESEDRFALTRAPRLSAALDMLASETPDAVILDLSLPDSQGLATFSQLHERAPNVPIIVLTGLTDEEVGVEAVRSGAQDFLLKMDVTAGALVRALRYGIERQRAEVTRARLAAIIESSSDAIISTTPENIILSWNDSAVRMFGYSAAEAIGQSVSILIPSERSQELTIGENATKGEGIAGQLETIRVRKDGKKIDVSLSRSPIKDTAGRIIGISRIFHDITEHKQAEEALKDSEKRYRSVVRSMAEGVALLDGTGTIVAWNRSAERIMGLSAGEILRRGTFDPSWEIVREDGTPFPHKDHPDMVTLQTGRPQSNVCMGVRKPDGSLTWISINSQPIFGADPGDPQSVVVTFSDITERKRIEAEIRQLSAILLVIQDEERRRIARELHDSTAQSLAAIAINMDMLSRAGGLDSDAQKRVAESATLAKQCSEEIRNVSYLLHPPLLDEMGLASALRFYVESFARRSGIHVDLEVSHELGRLPKDAETALFRIAQESLTNILRHSGSPTARVRIGRDATGAKLEIEDAGSGMRAIGTEMFDGRRVRPGVGISGMRERLRLLGGKLEIKSSPRGTTVKASLPLDGSDFPSRPHPVGK